MRKNLLQRSEKHAKGARSFEPPDDAQDYALSRWPGWRPAPVPEAVLRLLEYRTGRVWEQTMIDEYERIRRYYGVEGDPQAAAAHVPSTPAPPATPAPIRPGMPSPDDLGD